MGKRGLRAAVFAALILGLSAPTPAQIRGVPLSLRSVPASPAAPAALASRSALSAVPALPSAAIAAGQVAAAPAAAPAAPSAAAPLSAPVPSANTRAAFSGFSEGRKVFDGAAAQDAPSPVPAPVPTRGDTRVFNGRDLPTRMFSDQIQISAPLIRAIGGLNKDETFDVAIYELAHREVFNALKDAKDRGVKIRIVLDEGHVYPDLKAKEFRLNQETVRNHEKAALVERGVAEDEAAKTVDATIAERLTSLDRKSQRTPEVDGLIAAGFELRTLRGGDEHGIMHNKFALFDDRAVFTGSFNWTRAADTAHFENALFDDLAARVASYRRDWDEMWNRARPVDLKNPPAPTVVDQNRKTPPIPPVPQDQDRPLDLNGKAQLPVASFTPRGTAPLVASAIDASDKDVILANFSFTNAEIIDALVRAKTRGVAVRLIFDRYQFGFQKEMQRVADRGFDVRLSDGKGAVLGNGRTTKGVMHNKFGVFDGKLVETGSFNMTSNGEFNNYENASFLNAPDDVAGYRDYFERIWNQAQPPTPADRRMPPPAPPTAPAPRPSAAQ